MANEKIREMISRQEILGETPITIDMVKAIMTAHHIDHLGLEDGDIKNRFLNGVYREGSEKRYAEQHCNIVSWFNSKEMMLNFCKAAFNSKILRGQVSAWINGWSAKDGYTFVLKVATKNAELGKFVTRRGSWKTVDASPCSNMVIVLELVSMNNSPNAGFRIKSCYPAPTNVEYDAHMKKVAR